MPLSRVQASHGDARATALFHSDWLGVNPVEDHQAALRFLFHDCSEETGRWALGTLREFVPKSLYTHTPAPEPPEITSLHVVPTAGALQLVEPQGVLFRGKCGGRRQAR